MQTFPSLDSYIQHNRFVRIDKKIYVINSTNYKKIIFNGLRNTNKELYKIKSRLNKFIVYYYLQRIITMFYNSQINNFLSNWLEFKKEKIDDIAIRVRLDNTNILTNGKALIINISTQRNEFGNVFESLIFIDFVPKTIIKKELSHEFITNGEIISGDMLTQFIYHNSHKFKRNW